VLAQVFRLRIVMMERIWKIARAMTAPGRIPIPWLCMILLLLPVAQVDACGGKRYCRQMRDCAEARHYFEDCGLSRLDGDNDGIPCETLCGGNHLAYGIRSRRRDPPPASRMPLPLLPRGGGSIRFVCGSKRYCREMTSCEEAMFHLKECGLARLDGNGDGIPCNRLCRQPRR